MDRELEIWQKELIKEISERIANEHQFAETVRAERHAAIEGWKKQRRWLELRAEKDRCIEVDRQEHIICNERYKIDRADFDWIDHGATCGLMLRPEKPLNLRCERCKKHMGVPFDVFPKNPPFFYFDIDCLYCSRCNPLHVDSVQGKRIVRWLELARREAADWYYFDLAIEGLDEDGWRHGADVVPPTTISSRRKRSGLSPSVRFEVLKRDGFRCAYCGATPGEDALHVDHAVSVADGGSDTIENLVTACQTCNLGKGSTSVRRPPN